MDIGSIFLILGILLLVSLYISQPFLKRGTTFFSQEEQEYSKLLVDRDRVLNMVRDLDFDYALGKIPQESYPSERAHLLQKGAGILQRMDEFRDAKDQDDFQVHVESHPCRGNSLSFESQVPTMSDDELEVLIANRVRDREEKSNGFCPGCGHAIQQSDLFCPRCGHSLKVTDHR